MTPRMQRVLALSGAAAVVALFLGANLHLVRVATQSQPVCVAVIGAPVPARQSC